jgi:hypothetical protein
MKTYKYFSKSDTSKEQIGTLQARSIAESYLIASGIKKLPLQEFRKLFKIEKI